MEFERRTRRIQELNLTPLVDIILLLVIFFMISTSFVVSDSMELSLPSGKADGSAQHITRILIQPSGEVVVNQQPMDGNALNSHLANLLAANAEEKIAIFTTPGVSVQQLVSVMDMVYLTGGKNVQVDKVEVPYGS